MLAAAVDRTSPFELHPTTERERADLAVFLARTLNLPAGISWLGERHMRWRYWSPRPDWGCPRSFIAGRGGAMMAHIGVWPLQVRVPEGVLTAGHGIDWAADPACPGAGIRLLRRVGASFRLMVATGGTEAARRVLPAIGFRPHGEIYRCARPVRPIGQALTTSPKTWRLPARLLRNTLWRLSPPLSSPAGWSAAPVDPDDLPERLWPEPSASIAVIARAARVYRYFLEAPSPRHLLFGLKRRSELAGYFCLALAPHVAHVADLWVASSRVEDWCAAFRTASDVAARDRDVYEVSAWASTTPSKEGLLRAGFRLRERTVVSLAGDVTSLRGRELHFQMIDCDASLLSHDVVSYLT